MDRTSYSGVFGLGKAALIEKYFTAIMNIQHGVGKFIVYSK
jgi:hypothetical protein